jgi:hypothetical protein
LFDEQPHSPLERRADDVDFVRVTFPESGLVSSTNHAFFNLLIMLVSQFLFEQFVVQVDDNGAPILRRGWGAEVIGR